MPRLVRAFDRTVLSNFSEARLVATCCSEEQRITRQRPKRNVFDPAQWTNANPTLFSSSVSVRCLTIALLSSPLSQGCCLSLTQQQCYGVERGLSTASKQRHDVPSLHASHVGGSFLNTKRFANGEQQTNDYGVHHTHPTKLFHCSSCVSGASLNFNSPQRSDCNASISRVKYFIVSTADCRRGGRRKVALARGDSRSALSCALQ